MRRLVDFIKKLLLMKKNLEVWQVQAHFIDNARRLLEKLVISSITHDFDLWRNFFSVSPLERKPFFPEK